MSHLTLAKGDDWIGIYIDDKLVYENHSIEALELLQIAVENEVLGVSQNFVDLKWLDDHGYLPSSLNEVVWEE